MRIAGFDPATNTGWAVIDESGVPRAGVFKAPGTMPKKATPQQRAEIEAERLSGLRSDIRSLLIIEKVDFAAIEAPLYNKDGGATFEDDSSDFDLNAHMRGGGKARKPGSNPKTDAFLHALHRLVCMTCFELQIPFAIVPVSTHRKAFLGAGRIAKGEGKDLTLAQCNRMGLKIRSKDAADAVSIAWWGAGHKRQQTMIKGEDLFEGVA